MAGEPAGLEGYCAACCGPVGSVFAEGEAAAWESIVSTSGLLFILFSDEVGGWMGVVCLWLLESVRGLTWIGPLHAVGKGLVCYKVVAPRAGVCDEDMPGGQRRR